jgi:hypothetical protein
LLLALIEEHLAPGGVTTALNRANRSNFRVSPGGDEV